MNDSRDWHDPISDLEAMVRAAGGYVQPSDDLRPCVLEASRMQRGERRAQRCLRQLAVFVVLLTIFIPAGAKRRETADLRFFGPSVVVDADVMFSRAESNSSANGGDLSWGMVEAFTELRRDQADALRIGI